MICGYMSASYKLHMLILRARDFLSPIFSDVAAHHARSIRKRASNASWSSAHDFTPGGLEGEYLIQRVIEICPDFRFSSVQIACDSFSIEQNVDFLADVQRAWYATQVLG